MNKNIKVTSQELKQLLLHIQNPTLNICIRFRLIGQMWQRDFMRVVAVTESIVTLQNDEGNKLYVVNNLNDVIQFEIDQRLFQYEPHFHYYHEPTPA